MKAATILILSGDVFSGMILEDMLCEEGAKVLTTSYDQEAYDILVQKRSEISGIICDEIFIFLADRALLPDVPIVLIASNEDRKETDSMAVVRKPCQPIDIISALKEILPVPIIDSPVMEEKVYT